MAEKGAPHGTVLAAGQQTGGRGRLGRSFHSPAGKGIYLSVILRPECKPEALMHLTCAVAVAACDAIESVTGMRPGVKWINDLVCGKMKLGGILTELSLDAVTGTVRYAVVGIGINCTHEASDFPKELQCIATSLLTVTGKHFDPALLIAKLSEALMQMSDTLFTEKTATMEHYREACITVGQPIVLLRGDSKRYGLALGIEENGGLLVRFEDSTLEVVSSGEVSVRGMYGYT